MACSIARDLPSGEWRSIRRHGDTLFGHGRIVRGSAWNCARMKRLHGGVEAEAAAELASAAGAKVRILLFLSA